MQEVPNGETKLLPSSVGPDQQQLDRPFDSEQIRQEINPPLPRPKRTPRRAGGDRGLPGDDELARLAVVYLEKQRKLWPQLVEQGLLPEPSPDVVQSMVEDFKERHRGRAVDFETLRPLKKFCEKLAGAYNRFSCNNSKPTSISDQLVKSLDKAKQEGRFVPWQFVYADFSVTGLDASRQGYSSYKAVLSAPGCLLDTTYIDDFTRASRDELEWWKLASLSKRLEKRMIGASDGFDLSSPDWDMKITMYSLLSRMFIKSLREKVHRGRLGAARRGTCTGKLALGFTKRLKLDESGKPIIGSDGVPQYEPCIDPVTSKDRLLASQLFVEKKWSPYRIARNFNERNVDGSDGWSEKSIRSLLHRADAIGVFIWNKTRREYDWEERKWVIVKNPRSVWEVSFVRDRAIVPMELWRAARRELARKHRNDPRTGKKPSRNQKSSKTLFSGTLFCLDCGAELKLVRSAGDQQQMGCLNGFKHGKGCRQKASKSVRVIEECLLGYLRDKLLTEPVVHDLVEKANRFLEEEAQKPHVDIGPLKSKAKNIKVQIDRLVKKVAETDDDQLSAAYHERVVRLQKELNGYLAEIQTVEASQRRDCQPLDFDMAMLYMAEVRQLLNGDIPAAAEAIRELTGPISIRQEPIPGRKRGTRWIATFRPNLRLLLPSAYQKALPNISGSPTPQSEATAVEVRIEAVPDYERLAPEFLRLHENGASALTIAGAFGVSWSQVADGLHFAMTGERPKGKHGKRTGNGRQFPVYTAIADRVVHLRREQHKAFTGIAKELGVSPTTVYKAYDHAIQEDIRRAAESGSRIDRGRHSILDHTVFERIRELVKKGRSVPEIASEAGCSESTVRRELARMSAEARLDASPMKTKSA